MLSHLAEGFPESVAKLTIQVSTELSNSDYHLSLANIYNFQKYRMHEDIQSLSNIIGKD